MSSVVDVSWTSNQLPILWTPSSLPHLSKLFLYPFLLYYVHVAHVACTHPTILLFYVGVDINYEEMKYKNNIFYWFFICPTLWRLMQTLRGLWEDWRGLKKFIDNWWRQKHRLWKIKWMKMSIIRIVILII